MDIFGEIKESLVEILDIEAEQVTPETYIVRDLNAESIDLLELSVALNSRFKVAINEDEIYLRNLRVCLNGSNHNDAATKILAEFPFLGTDRAGEILKDLDGGPVLKVKDLARYISWQIEKK